MWVDLLFFLLAVLAGLPLRCGGRARRERQQSIDGSKGGLGMAKWRHFDVISRNRVLSKEVYEPDNND